MTAIGSLNPTFLMRFAASMCRWLRPSLGILLATAAGAADSSAPKGARSLADLSIQELMNESITGRTAA